MSAPHVITVAKSVRGSLSDVVDFECPSCLNWKPCYSMWTQSQSCYHFNHFFSLKISQGKMLMSGWKDNLDFVSYPLLGQSPKLWWYGLEGDLKDHHIDCKLSQGV